MLAIARGHHAWRCNTCLDVVGRRWCRTGVGDFPRMGDLVVMSRGFVGVYRGFAVSAVFSRRRFQGRFFTNRGFPTFPWGQYPRGRQIPVNSQPDTGEQARTGKSQPFSRIIHIPPPESRPPPPPSTLTVIPASANASTDTDNSPNVNRRLRRHRQPPQRQQTLLPTLTVHSASANAFDDTGNCLGVGRRAYGKITVR